MPPKRQLAGDAMNPSRSKRKRKVPNATDSAANPVEVHSLDSCDVLPQAEASPAIDYDKLAAAILKQTSQKPPSATEPQQELPPSGQLQSPLLPSDQPGPSTSGIGSILDQVFLGEPARSSTHSLDIKDGIPLGASVSIKLRQKIWCNEYIDLKSLLDTKDEPLSVTISTGVINLHQGQKSKVPISLGQWTDAFLIFSAIYLEKFPTEAPNLLKYCHMIREMQYLHGDQAFRMYDEHFRKLRETVNAPWQNPVQELRLKAATTKFQFQKPQQNQPFRTRFCFQFNKGERCSRSPCPFKHICMRCKSNHPKSKCPDAQKSNYTKPSYTSQGRKSE